MQLECCVEEKFRKNAEFCLKGVWVLREGINYCKDIQFLINGKKRLERFFKNIFNQIKLFFMRKVTFSGAL